MSIEEVKEILLYNIIGIEGYQYEIHFLKNNIKQNTFTITFCKCNKSTCTSHPISSQKAGYTVTINIMNRNIDSIIDELLSYINQYNILENIDNVELKQFN